ncbi:hypothetical protein KM043_004217 [Ampulex compressa]|nr:hypothetical protein KM043_004217 [Ampulex compressa]
MEPGTLATVLHDFFTTIDEELCLCKGQYFLIHDIIDKHWCYGQSQEKRGKFPLSHLHKTEIPQLSDTEQLFICTADFVGQEEGDLSISKGQIIVGTKDINGGWYFGQIGSRTGIFPVTHTWHIDRTLLKKAAKKKSIRKKAKIKATLSAQLDEELDLTQGDIVTVLEILDDGWCRGVTEDGREGIFPEGFISYIDEDDMTDRVEPLRHMEPIPIAPVCNGAAACQDTSESLFDKMYDEEPAPNYFDLFPSLRVNTSEAPESTPCDNNVNPLDVKPYAITLYPFNAQFPNELSFGAGEIVHLIRHIDSEWIEGMIDNHKGIFPGSYVNVIVDCVKTPSDEAILNEETSSVEYNMLEPGTLVKVEYNFKAQMNGDLSVTEGDTVTVVDIANNDWINVKNQSGEVGLCPRAYLSQVSTPSTELIHDLLEDFVVIRNDQDSSAKSTEQRTKRLSEPHRPAPPVPAPGRVPLEKEMTTQQGPSEGLQVDIVANSEINARQRRADQRQNVISELVLTEKEYVRDLKLTYETFNLYDPNFLEAKGIDVTVLFGNFFDVIQIAEELLDMILRSMKGCDEDLQKVGPCFTKMAEKLQNVYVKYCGNHEAALCLLKKYENNEEIVAVFNKGIETLRHQIACFDMSSILIKPVQRILKYPLILYELIKCTDDDHPDKATIEEAWKTMTHVASYINEYKRRKDLVSKYLDNDNTLMRKMAKLNMHSVAKMSTRLSTKLSASLGLTNLTVDPDFEELERQFRSVEKCTWQLAKDVEQCITYLSEEAISGEVISDYLIQYYQGTANAEVKRLRDIRSVIWSQFMQDLKSCLERRVRIPLHLLATLLEGPTVLITKRHDKLLDYDAAISKSEKYKESRLVQEELSVAKSNFEALTHQLLEELPVLISAATNILVSCIGAFAHARKLLSGKITKRYLSLCESSTQLSPQDILESFIVNHNLLWNQITRFSFAGSNPRVEEAESKWCPQSERQRIILRNKYSTERLYIVTENIISTSSLDMGVTRGSIVAVIKKQDPMGDANRWYVDNGVAQGFLPSQKLQPFQQSQSVDQNSTILTTNQNNMPDLISMDSPEKEIKLTPESHLQDLLDLNINEECKISNHYSNLEQPTRVPQYQNLSYEFYYAMYDFSGNIPGTLPIAKGQALRLVRPHDEKGNDAWWLVEDRYGHKGYVPQNYLVSGTVARK